MAGSRLSRFGVGPKIAIPAFVYTVAALVVSYRWPGTFMVRPLSEAVRIVGAVLTTFGVLLWLAAMVPVGQAYNRDQLVTSGVFGLVRHPMYSGWITLAFPGLALLIGSWPMLVTPFLGYVMFKRLIHREDEYLEKRYGQAYRNYRERVNEVVPIPRFGRKRAGTITARSGK